MTEQPVGYDVIIIGGGPAGMSAALWCRELGLSTVLFERESEAGGQLLRIYNPIVNYLGIEAKNGSELRNIFLRQLSKSNRSTTLGCTVRTVDLDARSVVLENGDRFDFKGLIAATGVRRRRLSIPGESEFAGRGVLESGSKQRESVRGQNVVIIGGGDAAFENAMILSDYAKRVTVVHRRSAYSARAQFLSAVAEIENVTFMPNTSPTAILGSSRARSVEIRNLQSGLTEYIAADSILIRIGVEPVTEIFQGKIDLDEQGYIRVDQKCATSFPGVFAAGDAASPTSPTISTAAGMGSTAAKAVADWLNREH
ncbi:MAG: FAD-dependent oxidoreductase [Pyrinomonadaceae bacterium]